MYVNVIKESTNKTPERPRDKVYGVWKFLLLKRKIFANAFANGSTWINAQFWCLRWVL